MFTQTVYCDNTQCTQREIQTTQYTDANPTPIKFCPYCGNTGTGLQSADDYHRNLFIQSLAREGFTLTPTMYDKVYARFRAQTAFTDFRHYVNVLLFDDPITRDTTNNNRVPNKFHYSNTRKPSTPLTGQFGQAYYPTPSPMPQAGNQ
jgi:hypothetical protein